LNRCGFTAGFGLVVGTANLGVMLLIEVLLFPGFLGFAGKIVGIVFVWRVRK
jgi:hypothetical protein